MLILPLWVLALLCGLCCGHADPISTSSPTYRSLPSLRKQAEIVNGWKAERIANIPGILRKHGVDAWLMSQREYAEDTVFWSLKSATQFSARRRTVQLFLANAKHGDPLSYTWIENTPGLWPKLLEVLEAQDPSSIVVNINSDVSFAGGLHVGELDEITKRLGKKWESRFVIKPMVAVEFVGTMITSQLDWYRRLQETAWAMISEGFSEKVIVPGKSTTEDVEWWLREKIQQMNYTTWFMPDVEIVGPESGFWSADRAQSNIIKYGDILHVDFGVTALGLNTDTQHLAYVLRPGQTAVDIPVGLVEGLKKVNRLQDIVKANMKVGRTGNEILKTCLEQMKSEGIRGKIYSHPIGDWGHSAGTLIGMTNLQDGVPVLGDLPLLNKTYYSVELYAEHFVKELNATLPFFQEEDIHWVAGDDEWDWVYGQQKSFHLVRTPAVDDWEPGSEWPEL